MDIERTLRAIPMILNSFVRKNNDHSPHFHEIKLLQLGTIVPWIESVSKNDEIPKEKNLQKIRNEIYFNTVL